MTNLPLVLSAASQALFTTLFNDAPNWSGEPLLPNLTASEKGNLTDLKQKGLLTTEVDFEDRTITWVFFTEAGLALGLELTGHNEWGNRWVTPPAPIEPPVPAQADEQPVPAHPSEQPVTPPAPKLRTFDDVTQARMNLAKDFLQGAADPDRNATSCVDLAISFLVSATARLDGSTDHLDYLLEQVTQNFQHAVAQQAEEG